MNSFIRHIISSYFVVDDNRYNPRNTNSWSLLNQNGQYIVMYLNRNRKNKHMSDVRRIAPSNKEKGTWWNIHYIMETNSCMKCDGFYNRRLMDNLMIDGTMCFFCFLYLCSFKQVSFYCQNRREFKWWILHHWSVVC